MDIDQLLPFIRFKTSRSGGSGGQHVNKVSTKVELLFDLQACPLFSVEEKSLLQTKLHARLLADGLIQVISQESRSQLSNKENAVTKLVTLLQLGLKRDKIRKNTKPSKKASQKRLDAKRQHSMKKINRKILE